MTDPTDPTEQALRLAEALIFASADPVPTRQLATLLGPEAPDAADILTLLAERTATRGVNLVETGGGWMFRTAPDLAPALARIVEKPRRLPRAAMETLSVIAYHQPCTRADIEDRRGVALAPTTLELLLETGLITPAGHRETPGRPALWVTSNEFLTRFGLRTLADLPKRDDIIAGSPAIPPDRNSAPTEPVLNGPDPDM